MYQETKGRKLPEYAMISKKIKNYIYINIINGQADNRTHLQGHRSLFFSFKKRQGGTM